MGDERNWYVLETIATNPERGWRQSLGRVEQAVAAAIGEGLGFETLVPMVTRRTKSGRTVALVKEVMFPGYVLVRCPFAETVGLKRVRLASQVLAHSARDYVPDETVDKIKLAELEVVDWSGAGLKAGELARVAAGEMFEGEVGELLARDGLGRCTLLLRLRNGSAVKMRTHELALERP